MSSCASNILLVRAERNVLRWSPASRAQVGTLWDDSSEEAKGEWQSHVDNADVLIMVKGLISAHL